MKYPKKYPRLQASGGWHQELSENEISIALVHIIEFSKLKIVDMT